jgi:hypothetical protein
MIRIMMRPDPPELRVLSALAAGASTPGDLESQVGDLGTPLPAVLDWVVSQGYAERIDLAGGPSYSLTPKGLQTVALRQELGQAVDASGNVDFAAATRLVMENWSAAKGVAADDAVREQAGWLADDAARDHVTSGLNQAYAQGALTKDELDTRTGQALAARTMGELRTAGAGVVELPPLLPQGVHMQSSEPAPSSWQPQVYVNPRLKQIRWGPAGSAVGLGLIGLIGLVVQPLVGLAILVVAAVLLVVALRH